MKPTNQLHLSGMKSASYSYYSLYCRGPNYLNSLAYDIPNFSTYRYAEECQDQEIPTPHTRYPVSRPYISET
jgi:hypothetical protein